MMFAAWRGCGTIRRGAGGVTGAGVVTAADAETETTGTAGRGVAGVA